MFIDYINKVPTSLCINYVSSGYISRGHLSKPMNTPHTIIDEQPNLKDNAKQFEGNCLCDFCICPNLFLILNEDLFVHITFFQLDVVQC